MYNRHQDRLWYRKGLIKDAVQHSSQARGALEVRVCLRHQTFKKGIRICLRKHQG